MNPMQSHWLLCTQPAEYKFSSAMFYEQNLDEFSLLSHFCEVFQMMAGGDTGHGGIYNLR